jgi:hypothetical protein
MVCHSMLAIWVYISIAAVTAAIGFALTATPFSKRRKGSKRLCPSIRPLAKARGALTPALLRGPAATGHPWPNAAIPASMPGCPLRNACVRPLGTGQAVQEQEQNQNQKPEPEPEPEPEQSGDQTAGLFAALTPPSVGAGLPAMASSRPMHCWPGNTPTLTACCSSNTRQATSAECLTGSSPSSGSN